MEDMTCDRPDVDEILDLGMVLGQNQAFGFLAGRCSAAQAEALRRLRNEKLYKRINEHWRDFCPQYLRMSGGQADKIIALWEEFGAGYFELAQLTRVSPETYRALAPAVEDGVLKLNGEQIELTVENSRKVAAAVAEVRRNLPPKTAATAVETAVATAELPLADRVARLEQICFSIGDEFRAVPRESSEIFERYKEVVIRLFDTLREIRRQFRY